MLNKFQITFPQNYYLENRNIIELKLFWMDIIWINKNIKNLKQNEEFNPSIALFFTSCFVV